MKPPKALLIDLDDTLVCFDGDVMAPWVEAIEAVGGIPVPVDLFVDEVMRQSMWYFSDAARHRIGRNNLETTRRLIVRGALKKLNHQNDKLADELGDRYSTIRNSKLQLYPGTREALETLKQRGMPMCLVTNGEAHLQRRKIERFILEPYFKGILIEGEMGYGKPDERVFKRALDIVGASAEETWIVGDNFEWEVIAPQKLGITCLWIDKRKNGPPADTAVRPDAVIHRFGEVMDLIAAAESAG